MSAKLNLVARIAPVAPPCYESRMQWLEYLASAADSQKSTRLFTDRGAVVLLTPADGEPRINPDFEFCRDCSAQHSDRMLRAGKCKPYHLRDLQQLEPEAAA